jgi:hypothetical protein
MQKSAQHKQCKKRGVWNFFYYSDNVVEVGQEGVDGISFET